MLINVFFEDSYEDKWQPGKNQNMLIHSLARISTYYTKNNK